MTATVITMADRRMFFLLGVKANKHLDNLKRAYSRSLHHENCCDVRFVPLSKPLPPTSGYASRGEAGDQEAVKQFAEDLKLFAVEEV